jgi:hypothetical protein
MDTPDGPPVLRIGELSRRLGVSDHVLRAWENRYGLLQPVRSPGGLRLMVFGIVLHRNGWRIGYLGPSTPVEELERAVDASHPGLVVLAATRTETLEPLRPELASLARRAPLALAGAGATAQIATAVGARLMAGDPVTEAERAG